MAQKPVRRFLIWLGAVCLTLLAIPPLQVIVTIFVNPMSSPMQAQRKIEAWWQGERLETHPIKWVTIKEVPVRQIHFIWASEDQMFFRHGGFDLPQLSKAIAEAWEKGDTVRGASTITNQCARSVYLWQGRYLIRKALEAYYTFWMEVFLSKPRILELYLNHIELGSGVYGLGAAADYYFQKTPAELSRSQMIALAAILPNPREWSPVEPTAIVRQKIRRVERLASRSQFPAKELEE